MYRLDNKISEISMKIGTYEPIPIPTFGGIEYKHGVNIWKIYTLTSFYYRV